MSNYTEGPWFVRSGTGLIIKAKNCVIACAALLRGDDWDKAKANAQLIAAAPELLEALEEALPMLHTGDELPMSYYKDKPGALGKALRAIAKAKGEV